MFRKKIARPIIAQRVSVFSVFPVYEEACGRHFNILRRVRHVNIEWTSIEYYCLSSRLQVHRLESNPVGTVVTFQEILSPLQSGSAEGMSINSSYSHCFMSVSMFIEPPPLPPFINCPLYCRVSRCWSNCGPPPRTSRILNKYHNNIVPYFFDTLIGYLTYKLYVELRIYMGK